MGRTAVRRVEPHRTRRQLDGAVLAGLGVLVLFALIGLVSAGVFVASKVSGSSTPTKHHNVTGSSVAVQDVSRAQAQATAIVAAAQSASQNLVKSATKDARTRASTIVANANKQAKGIVTRAQATAPAPVVQQPVAPQQPIYSAPATGTGIATGGTVGTTGSTAPRNVVPNLSKLPSSWLVVAYNATFGAGPGGVGGISVINRGRTPFSGVASVHYTGGGSAQAYFSGLAPGQTATLPLNGKAYKGGGFTIQMSGVH